MSSPRWLHYPFQFPKPHTPEEATHREIFARQGRDYDAEQEYIAHLRTLEVNREATNWLTMEDSDEE